MLGTRAGQGRVGLGGRTGRLDETDIPWGKGEAGLAGMLGGLGTFRGTSIHGVIGLPGVTHVFLVLHFLFLGCSTVGSSASAVDGFPSETVFPLETAGVASGSPPGCCSPPSSAELLLEISSSFASSPTEESGSLSHESSNITTEPSTSLSSSSLMTIGGSRMIGFRTGGSSLSDNTKISSEIQRTRSHMIRRPPLHAPIHPTSHY